MRFQSFFFIIILILEVCRLCICGDRHPDICGHCVTYRDRRGGGGEAAGEKKEKDENCFFLYQMILLNLKETLLFAEGALWN